MSEPPSCRSAQNFIAGNPLRAVAALSVLVYHVAYFSLGGTRLGWFDHDYGRFTGRVLGSLYLGLFVFFVLSGYLISSPFVRAFVAGTPLPRIRPYMRRRLLRIVPASWIILTIVLLCWGTMGASPGQLAAVYGFAQNYGTAKITRVIGQAWTLDVEIAFYVLVPIVTVALAYACRRSGEQNRRRMLFAALTAGALGSLAVRAFGPSSLTPSTFAWQTSLPAMVFAFTPGVALAVIETTGVPGWLRGRGSILPAGVLLTVAIVVFAIYAARGQAVTPQFVDAASAFLAALGTGALVGAVLVFQWSTGRCWRTLDNWVMHWIGERSYSLYLVHQPVAVAIAFSWSALDTSPRVRLALLVPVVLTVSLLAAAVSYRYFERPFLRTRKLIVSPPEANTPLPGAPRGSVSQGHALSFGGPPGV